MLSGALKVQAHDDVRGLKAITNTVAVNYSHQTDANLGAKASFGDNRVNNMGTKEDLEVSSCCCCINLF